MTKADLNSSDSDHCIHATVECIVFRGHQKVKKVNSVRSQKGVRPHDRLAETVQGHKVTTHARPLTSQAREYEP